jgi:hypothetical protein
VCYWEATVLGDENWQSGGDIITYTRTELESAGYFNLGFTLEYQLDPSGETKPGYFDLHVQGTADEGFTNYPAVGDLGEYRISGRFTIGDRSYHAAQFDLEGETGPVLIMNVTESTDTVLAGTIQGDMVYEDLDGFQGAITLDMRFRAAPSTLERACSGP